ncbi:MAG: hypothetical protein U0X91_02880 [Spirosomataceae bacterium]
MKSIHLMLTKVMLLIGFFTPCAHAQKVSFPEACLGRWTGMMYMYKHGTLRDSVSVRLTVTKHTDADAWGWKTEYLSARRPAVKDYVLRLKDATKNLYVTDEGGGLALTDYLVGNKLYSVFETGGFLLTSSYELIGDLLIFEVTSGKKETVNHPEVVTYSTDNLQRVVFSHEK